MNAGYTGDPPSGLMARGTLRGLRSVDEGKSGMWNPVFERVVSCDGERGYRVGHQLIDEFLEFVAGRARPNTVKAYAHDLKVFFAVVGKQPPDVTSRQPYVEPP